MRAKRSLDLISDSVDAVFHAQTLDEAIDGIAATFLDAYRLWRVSFVLMEPDRGRILAAWSPGEHLLSAGTETRFELTEAVRVLADRALAGQPQLIDITASELGLIADVYRSEGVRSWLALPLRRRERVRGLLNLASASPDVFGPEDVTFFVGVAAGIQARLFELLDASGRMQSDTDSPVS